MSKLWEGLFSSSLSNVLFLHFHYISYVRCKCFISGKREKKGNYSLFQGGLDVHQSKGDGQRAGEAAFMACG